MLHTVREIAAAATPLKFVWLNAQLADVGAQIGFPVDQLRAALCLFAAYPFAIVLRQLHGARAKHWMNICVGLSMAQFVYGSEWLHSFGSALITYALMKYGPIKHAPYIVFVFNMLYVAALHVYRMSVDYMGWSIDCTASQMLLLIKLTSFGFNYYDGNVASATVIDAAKDSPATIKVKQTRQKYAITKIPSLLEYYGFVYGFTTFIAGPAFEYREYIDAINGARFVLPNGQRCVPSCFLAALKKFCIGVFFLALLAVAGSYANLPAILSRDEPISVKWGRILLALFLTRGKYYAAWKLAEGSTIVSGAGFEGFDAHGNAKGWNGVSNIDILGFEFGESVRDLSRSWNKGTQAWLERYVYARTGNSLVATYLCSAIWHGFYPGYYLFFLTIPLATAVNRLARRHIRPHFLGPSGSEKDAGVSKLLYDVVGMLATALMINYLAVSFVVLSWEQAIAGFASMHFAGHIGLVVAYVVLSLLPTKRPATKSV
uniref:Lysophospholipid acyltransferase n=1 Tax=Globisporangium ultimum (strain ATCC 200006 / CBS 805.95 / DAOM BR144) TaxID=431595 RepID=K3WUZ5_GLOUD